MFTEQILICKDHKSQSYTLIETNPQGDAGCMLTHINYTNTQPLKKTTSDHLQSPGFHQACGLMSDLVICKHRIQCGHTWYRMSSLRSGVIKWHKTQLSLFKQRNHWKFTTATFVYIRTILIKLFELNFQNSYKNFNYEIFFKQHALFITMTQTNIELLWTCSF